MVRLPRQRHSLLQAGSSDTIRRQRRASMSDQCEQRDRRTDRPQTPRLRGVELCCCRGRGRRQRHARMTHGVVNGDLGKWPDDI